MVPSALRYGRYDPDRPSTKVRDSVDQIIERVRRVLRLDNTVFTEIANDESALGPAVGVAALPKGAQVEMDAILALVD